jgi:hypothetical protein
MPISGGMVFVFSTRGSAEAVRLRAQALAEDFEKRTSPDVPPLTTKVIDVPDGARVEIRALWQNDVRRAREYLHDRAAEIRASGSCPTLRSASR